MYEEDNDFQKIGDYGVDYEVAGTQLSHPSDSTRVLKFLACVFQFPLWSMRVSPSKPTFIIIFFLCVDVFVSTLAANLVVAELWTT